MVDIKMMDGNLVFNDVEKESIETTVGRIVVGTIGICDQNVDSCQKLLSIEGEKRVSVTKGVYRKLKEKSDKFNIVAVDDLVLSEEAI